VKVVANSTAAQGDRDQQEERQMLRVNRIIGLTAIMAVCALPASAAAMPDAYMPHSPAAAEEQARQAGTTGGVDLRTPDTRDAARDAATDPGVDLRSPDARDAGREPQVAPTPEPIVQVRDVPESGFDWGDAGIGAAGMLALLSIAGGSLLLLGGTKRRRRLQAAH
jgi:hypothetical protein